MTDMGNTQELKTKQNKTKQNKTKQKQTNKQTNKQKTARKKLFVLYSQQKAFLFLGHRAFES